MPVDLHRARNVPGVVKEHVFIGFDDDDVRVVEVLGEPARGNETLGM